MPMMKNVLGLDIGSHSIKAVELRQTFRGLEPVQLRMLPRVDPDAPIADSLRRFVAQNDLDTEYVACAIPGDHVSTRRLEFPFRDRKRLDSAVPFAIEGLIPFELEDVLIDWQLLGSSERNQASITATIAQRGDVSTFLASLDEAGCHTRVLEAEGLALANLAALFDLSGVRAILDLGHRKSTICVMVDEEPIAARSIPVGALAITQAIAADRGLSLEDAERVKCEQGLFHTDFNPIAPSAMEPLDRIAREVLRSLEGIEDQLGAAAESAVSAITLVGGGARLHRVDEYLSKRIGVACERLSPPADPDAAALVAGGDLCVFGPAIALALRATARAKTDMNFRQDEFAYRMDLSRLFTKELRPTAILAAVTLGLLTVSAATSLALESRLADRYEKQAAQIYTQIFPDRKAPERPMSGLSQAVTEARERADFLGLYGGNLSALDLLTELSARVPKELDVRFEEVSIDNKLIRIKVAANNYEAQDRLENELKREKPFTAATVSGKSQRDKDGSVTFSISINMSASEGSS